MPTLAPKLPYTHPFAGGYLYRGSQRLPSDPDALAYLAAVAAADGAPVETAVAVAVDDFFKGCKADPSGTPGRSNWDAIKASCILCGARTLAGALVPLVGTAPTNVADGFVSGDYTRGGAAPGLQGDGTSYLDSGRNNNADLQNDRHLSVYATSLQSNSGMYIDGQPSGGSLSYLRGQGTALTSPLNSSFRQLVNGHTLPGLLGSSRSASTSLTILGSGIQQTFSDTSVAPPSRSIGVFGPNPVSDAKIAFYSIGEALDLEALDARVTALVTAIGAAV